MVVLLFKSKVRASTKTHQTSPTRLECRLILEVELGELMPEMSRMKTIVAEADEMIMSRMKESVVEQVLGVVMVAVLLGEMMVVVEVTMTCNLQEVDTVEVEMVAEVVEAEEEVAIVDP